jgi:hypothetical protein
MGTYNKSEVFKRAWKIYRRYPNLSWSQCLTRSWEIEKTTNELISRSQLNYILNSLKPISAKFTKEHFRFLNSKKAKTILNKSSDEEVKEMVSEGVLFLNDIMHQRRIDSKKYNFTLKSRNKFRNRIVDTNKCVKINIEEYINGNC